MEYASFLSVVEQVGGLTPEEAERAIEATLETLSERITGGEAREIAAFLPKGMRGFLADTREEAERFGLEEFYGRVAEREAVDPRTAAAHARAVFVALGVAVAPGELRDMAAQLPKDFEPLLQATGVGRRRATREPYDLTQRVAELAGIEREQAQGGRGGAGDPRRAHLGGRGRGPQEGDPEQPPPRARPRPARAPRRGLDEPRRVPRPHRGARGHQPRRRARPHPRRVRRAARDVTGKEFRDMAAQLPDEYAPLLAATDSAG